MSRRESSAAPWVASSPSAGTSSRLYGDGPAAIRAIRRSAEAGNSRTAARTDAGGGAQSQSIRLKNRYMRAMAIAISAKAAG